MRDHEIKLTKQMRNDIKSSVKTLQMMKSMVGGYIHPELNEELDKSERKMKTLLTSKKYVIEPDNTVNKKYLYIAAGIAIGLVALLILVDNIWH